ncbi:MAG: hypothetical protein ACXABY_04205 [Candidatus Thorarchaeota archaeon]
MKRRTFVQLSAGSLILPTLPKPKPKLEILEIATWSMSDHFHRSITYRMEILFSGNFCRAYDPYFGNSQFVIPIDDVLTTYEISGGQEYTVPTYKCFHWNPRRRYLPRVISHGRENERVKIRWRGNKRWCIMVCRYMGYSVWKEREFNET